MVVLRHLIRLSLEAKKSVSPIPPDLVREKTVLRDDLLKGDTAVSVVVGWMGVIVWRCVCCMKFAV